MHWLPQVALGSQGSGHRLRDDRLTDKRRSLLVQRGAPDGEDEDHHPEGTRAQVRTRVLGHGARAARPPGYRVETLGAVSHH